MLFITLAAIIGAVVGFERPTLIVDSLSRGKYVIAQRDIMPGELVMEEKEPILSFSANRVVSLDDSSDLINTWFAGFVAVRTLKSPSQREKILNLFGPVEGLSGENLRGLAGNMYMIEPGSTLRKPFSKEDVELFVKVSSIVKFNAFQNEGKWLLFENITRLSHSCAANCEYHIDGEVCRCFAAKPIKTGEELTIAYNASRDLEPTHERRHKYLERKEFTCHCPRCDAIGDDTRQFDCFDPACKGVMMVCQPINKERLRGTDVTYTGVEYVEPHLLPCTVCHHPAPADYEAKMLALETEMPSLAAHFDAEQQRCLADPRTPADTWEALVQQIDRKKLPSRHMLMKPILDVQLSALTILAHYKKVKNQTRRVALQRIELMQNIFPYPHREVVNAIFDVCALCGCASPAGKAALTLSEEKVLLQKALRMHLILNGREKRRASEDNALAKVLSQLSMPQQQQQPQNMDICAFCEESPLHAAMKRSRCGKCRQVAYCSAGCQKAHWPLHKKTCTPDLFFN